MTVQQFCVVGHGQWSGGGGGWLANIAAVLDGCEPVRDQPNIPVIPRNVPSRPRLQSPFVLVPQNAWPWAFSGASRSELPRVLALRVGSEYFMRRAAAVLRISSAIPVIGTAHRYSPVIHNVLDPGFDTALAEADAEHPDTLGAFVCIGSIQSYRNHRTILDGYERYQRLGGSHGLVIVGPVGAKSVATEIQERAGELSGVRILLGPRPRAEILAMMRSSAGVILGSTVEASPFTALEALACTHKVVFSDILGHRELLAEYESPNSSILFSPGSADQVASALVMTDNGHSHPAHEALADPGFRADQRGVWVKQVGGWLTKIGSDLVSSKP